MFDILVVQVEQYRPDVFLLHVCGGHRDGFHQGIRPHIKLAVGQRYAPHTDLDLSGFDLILSSLPNFVEQYRGQGLRTEYFRLGLQPPRSDETAGPAQALRSCLRRRCRQPPSAGHQACGSDRREFNARFWGSGVDDLAPKSPIRTRHGGPLWPIEMFQALRDARIVLNRHFGAPGDFANNMRLYEATDWNRNPPDFLVPGEEVMAYRDEAECTERIRYYIDHEPELEQIARAGHARVLKEHTSEYRMQELVERLGRLPPGEWTYWDSNLCVSVPSKRMLWIVD